MSPSLYANMRAVEAVFHYALRLLIFGFHALVEKVPLRAPARHYYADH